MKIGVLAQMRDRYTTEDENLPQNTALDMGPEASGSNNDGQRTPFHGKGAPNWDEIDLNKI